MLLTQIKKDRMLAMKAGATKKYESLTTLFSEIQRLDKDDQEKDDKVQQVITKFIKSLKEMIVATVESGGDVDAFEKEIAILSEYLPKQLSEAELKTLIADLVRQEGAESPRDMGKIMKRLTTDHKGQYDGRLASQFVKEALS